MSFGS
jgi:hypothetical protein